ncbi:hypothetical protein [Streptomyces sp. SBT349]|uniref:hypothetical protein n=1 Tax=Streptomyces sp. SBT349 TaxID=1580539 RepID=UPI00066CAD99|nr:hypothetical protein [Streptomyces sp. SBT349]
MILIEVLTAAGALEEEGRRRLGGRLIDAFMQGDTVDEVPAAHHAGEVAESARALTQVLFHQPATWVLGGRGPADPADPPRYVVRISLPAPWRKDVSAEAIERLTGAVAAFEAEEGRSADRVLCEPHAWVQLLGVPEGSMGMLGRPFGSVDLIDHLTRPHRRAIGEAAATADLPEGHVLDPVCGMVVDLAATDLTLELDGTVHGFCHGQCRRVFADEHGVTVAGGAPA